MVVDLDSLAHLRSNGSVSNPLRDDSLHGSGCYQSSATTGKTGGKPGSMVVGRRYGLSVLLGYLRWLLRSRQRNSDAGSNGPIGAERSAQSKRHQEFSRHLYQQYRRLEFFSFGLVVWRDSLIMAVGALAGGYFGASLAVRIGQLWVRRGIIVIGFVIFVVMVWELRR